MSDVIEIPRGNHHDFIVTVVQVDLVTPEPITNDDVNFIIKKNKTDLDVDAIYNVTNTPATPHTDPANGITTFLWTNAQTDIATGMYYFEATLITQAGDITTLNDGSISIIEPLRDPTP